MVAAIKNRCLVLLTILLLLALSACGNASSTAVLPTPVGQFPVSSEFRDLYQNLGGEAELGPAISPPFTQKGIVCQYTTQVLLCFNPSTRSEADRLFLAPLGYQLKFPAYSPRQTGELKIFEGFSETYHKKFFGERYVGKPLTGVRYNKDQRRTEQYFENMGLYISSDDPQHKVHLLAYGSYVCRAECSQANPGSAIIGWDKGIEVLNPASVERLGGYAVLGDPLSTPYIGSDGNFEQVLEKAVIYIPAENPTTVRLRRLNVILNLPYNEPGPQRFGQKENVVFYVVKGDLGYHVPIMFDQFIASHGGMEISGQPVSDPVQVTVNGQNLGRQCYQNYCLDYNPAAAPEGRIQLTPLGKQYLSAQKRESSEVFQFSRGSVELTAAEQKPQISNKEPQVIQTLLRTRPSHQPIADIEAFVTLGMPDGTKMSYDLPPTNGDGMAEVTIPPLTKAPNGTIIPYIVCLNVPGNEQICSFDSFLIWNSQ